MALPTEYLARMTEKDFSMLGRTPSTCNSHGLQMYRLALQAMCGHVALQEMLPSSTSREREQCLT
eukprot:11475824-Alexandrium_andersonii.AAC.1